MATTIFFNGRLISVPGSYSEVDASGLEQVGLGASGIVAVLGTAEGGKPVSAITEPKDFLRYVTPERAKAAFRSGNLLEVMDFLFAPAKDPEILAGAQEVVAMKINPATQSEVTLANAQGNAIKLKSRDYGAFTAQINVSIAAGTTVGKLLTIKFEDVTETVDNLGGVAMFTLQYSGGANGYSTMTGQVESAGHIKATGTKTAAGAASLITTQLGSNGAVEILSSAAGDTTQAVTVYGVNSLGVAVKETATLNGTTVVALTTTWSKVYGISIVQSGVATVGTVTVRAAGAGAVIFDVPAGTENEGAILLEYGYVDSTTVTIAADAATTKKVLLVGKNAAGADVVEQLTLTGTTPVTSANSYSSISRICTGDVEAARTVTLTAQAARALATVHKTLQKAKDYFNAKQVVISGPTTRGFIFTMVTSQTAFLLTDLDVSVSATSITSATSFYADLYTMIDWINDNSQYVTAEKVSGTTGGFPSDTSSPAFLTGGSEGTATSSDWQRALNLLKKTRVNSIVVLTGDPAVHAALDAHCAYMCGIGRSERDGFVGLLNAGLTDVPTKTEVKSQITALNSRHIRACAQAVERFDSAGNRTEFLPYFGAALAAGMQAGTSVGNSLTFKYANCLAFRQDSSWNPVDDAEEMVKAGLWFLEQVDGVGRRCVRNITTHLSTNNIAFIEGSVNQAVNYAAYEFRTQMEFAVGKQGFSGTINATKGLAINKLGLLVDEGVLVEWRSLAFSLAVDVMEVSVEMAPVIPINFVKNTMHLVTVRQAA